MWVDMSRTSDRVKFLQSLSRVISILWNFYGLEFMIIWYHRTEDQQGELYKIGRSLPGKKVTNCDGVVKKSNHQFWIAGDVVYIQNDEIVWGRCREYEILGKVAREEGLRWGGDWDQDGEVDPTDYDIYHIELMED